MKVNFVVDEETSIVMISVNNIDEWSFQDIQWNITCRWYKERSDLSANNTTKVLQRREVSKIGYL